MENSNTAPGHPGVEPRWTSGRKSGVGTAIGPGSNVWFTLARGIVTEVYYPTMDCAAMRDFGFIVTADDDFFSEEKQDTDTEERPIEQGVPAYKLINTCRSGRYRITKTVVTDPLYDCLVVDVRFEALKGKLSDYRIYALVAPRIGNRGYGNNGWCPDVNGLPMLLAERGQTFLGVACSAGWIRRSCGYVGESDGWQELRKNRSLAQEHAEARDGNIALTGEISLEACDGRFTVVISFGRSAAQTAFEARATLFRGFPRVVDEYMDGWREFQSHCKGEEGPRHEAFDVYRSSTMVLRVHEAKQFPGGIIASLSIPWGERRGDDDIGGYHLVWPRDQWQAAVALLAAGQSDRARLVLFHLMCTQRSNGSWAQNMWLDGEPQLDASQLDQTAGFLLLADLLRRHEALDGPDPYASIRRAAAFLIEHGPETEQDRWEENEGHTPYTIALMMAGLVAAAEFAEARGDDEAAERMREEADRINERIEDWLYVTDTPLSREVGVEGYYVRIAPASIQHPSELHEAEIWLRNQPEGTGSFKVWEIVSPDALALVRFGIRSPHDPRIRNTLKVIDHTVRLETKRGPAWRRYSHDGYGEDESGNPFSGSGVGRCWPLLTGERAHYELAAGNFEGAEELMKVMVDQSHHGGLFPEQIWDADDIPERRLFNGQPTGGAMPLVWAHSEFLKLIRSIEDGEVFDRPPAVVRRYEAAGVEAGAATR